MADYVSLCEKLWQDWLANSLDVSEYVCSRFCLDAAPEPYLTFQEQTNPLIVLTTNPGASMLHQYRNRIRSGESKADASMSYEHVAKLFGRFYEDHLSGTAGRRIQAIQDVAERSGYSGVFQVECCPFHSARFPNKSEYLRQIEQEPLLCHYTTSLRKFLAERPVLAVSACSSQESLDNEPLRQSDWLKWQIELMGIQLSRTKWVPLVRKGSRVTSTALIDSAAPAVKVLVLMMGGNHLPGEEGRASLIREITGTKTPEIDQTSL